MIKKFFVFLVIFISAVSIPISSPFFAYADNTTNSSKSKSNNADETQNSGCRNFLGLDSWDCNIDVDNIQNQQDLSNTIWAIAANLLKDLTVIAAYLILGYVIYGGYQYIFSAGEPGKTASGKKTLVNSFIGLAIVLTANIIISTIRVALSADFSQDCISSGSCVNPTTMITGAFQWVIAISGIVAAIFVIYGGISYITSSGDSNKVLRAKQIIIYALIGLAIVALAEIITAFINNTINDATTQTSLLYSNSQLALKGVI